VEICFEVDCCHFSWDGIFRLNSGGGSEWLVRLGWVGDVEIEVEVEVEVGLRLEFPRP